MLLLVHAGLSAATKTPELELDEKEATSLASGITGVLDQFDIRPDPKIEAMIALVMVGASIYGPRVYLIRERLKAENAKRVEPSHPLQQYQPVE